MQNRYQGDNREEMFFFSYAHRYNSHQTRISFSNEVVKGRQGWVWDLETGERYRLPLDAANSFLFDFGPADSLLIVFDKQKRGNDYKPLPVSGEDLKIFRLIGMWSSVIAVRIRCRILISTN